MYFNEYTIKRRQKWQIFLWWDIMVNSNNYETKVWIYNEWKVWLFNYEKCKQEFEWKDLIQPYYISWETIDITKDNQWRQPTWPMLGFNLLTPPLDTKSRIKDNELLQETDFENLWIKTAKKYNIYWFRRPLWTKPKNLKYERNEKNDLILSFSLPTGSYATIFLWIVLDWIDDKTIVENWLEIPLIK
jgi:tRNA(Glu) U13 pseudouridine synthase TruD